MRVFCFTTNAWTPRRSEVSVVALAEDGALLDSHLCSPRYARRDIERRLANLVEEGRGPYEPVWVDDPETHSGVKLAEQRNERIAKELTGGSGIFRMGLDGEVEELTEGELQQGEIKGEGGYA